MREARALDGLPPPKAENRAPRADELLEALEALEEPERRLVESFYFEDHSQLELARRSGRSVKAIQCALARARQRLRQFFEKKIKP